MGGIGQAFGKLILFGEHAAVYGHPAVGVSLPEQTTVRLTEPVTPEWNLDSIPPEDRAAVNAVLGRVETNLPGLASRGRCRVLIESDVVRMSGFGSSAALCGAFARAALRHAEEPESRAWELAHDAERLFHGTPSGVDTGLSLLGGTCVLQPHPPGLPDFEKVPRRGLCLVVGSAQRDAACAALVGGLGARVRSGDIAARAGIAALGGISADAAGLLHSWHGGSEKIIGGLADRAMDQLRALGLSTPDLDRLLECARNAGALGGKLSGAGGGGAFFAVARDRESAARIVFRLEAETARSHILLTSPLRLIEA